MRVAKKQFLFSLIMLGFVVFFAEGILALASIVSPKIKDLVASPWVTVLPNIPDAKLGFRPNPEYLDHDKNGFRNPAVPHFAEIIALGDSQTYGTGVESIEAWPRQLEVMSGKKVYNMAFGGYGPAHSLILFDQAMAFHPKVIIEAIYSGNDLYDSYNLVYDKGSLATLKTEDLAVQERIQADEKLETITKKIERTYKISSTDVGKELEERESFNFLSKYSKLYGLLRRIIYDLKHPAEVVVHPQKSESEKWEEAKKFPKEIEQYFEIFDNGQFKTIFTSESRLLALDLEDSRIQEGYQISLKAIKRMHDIAASHGIRFIAVFIPTKEFVFRSVVQNYSERYGVLIDYEKKFWDLTADFLKQNNIEYVDASPSLEHQLINGIQPYQASKDGHPNALGQKTIAEVVNIQLQSSY